MKLSRIAVVLSMALGLGACTGSSIPARGEGEIQRTNFEKDTHEAWSNEEPSITYIKQQGKMVIDEPSAIPQRIKNITINTQFSQDSTLSDVAGMIRPMGVYLVIPDEKIRNKKIVIFDYNGKLGDFLDAIGAAYGISFNWNEGGIITAEEGSHYLLRIPQDKQLAKSIASDIKSLGADDVSTSIETGTVSYKASSRVNKRIVSFMERNSYNAALVSMQVAVITVALDKTQNSGIDWGNMAIALGGTTSVPSAGDLAAGAASALTGGTGGETGGTGGTGGTVTPSVTSVPKFALGGGATKVNYASGNFSLNAAINYLSTYGRTETSQSVLMKTLSGRDVNIKSGQKIPYIDSIGTSSMSSEGGVVSANTSNVEIKDVDIGLDLTLKPLYDAESEIVTIDVGLEINSLLSFIELSAGEQGKVTRPNTQTQSFTDVVKMNAGQSVLIGGVSFGTISDNRSAPSFLEKAGISSKNDKDSRNTMFVMIRPTVTVYGDFSKDKQVIRK